MVNWKALAFGLVVTLILAYLGNYIPYLDIPLAPIIGGIIAGFITGGSFKSGIVYGGVSASIIGFSYTLIVIMSSAGNTISKAVTTAVSTTSLSGDSGIITVIIIIIGAIIAFAIYFILGSIGGIVGVTIKERKAVQYILKNN
jgi:hypothetical protein